MAVHHETAEELVEEVFLFGRALKLAVGNSDSSLLPPALTGVLGMLSVHGECRQTELANQLCLSQSALSRQLSDLVEWGYITRTPDPDDRRAALVRVSRSGFEILERIKESRVARLSTMLGEWSEDQALAALESVRHLKETFTDQARHASADYTLIAR